MWLEQNSPMLFTHRRWLEIVASVMLVIALLLGTGFAVRWAILPIRTVASSSASTSVTSVTPAPTLLPVTPTITQPAPTRVPITPAAIQSPPTRVSLTPTPVLTPTNAALPRVQLLVPATGVVSGQTTVDFAWAIHGQSLRADDCFALVFWDPNQATAKVAPRGVSKATRVKVDFAALLDGPDIALRQLVQSSPRFNWGVRIVACASPADILKEAEDIRVYTYDTQ